MKTKEQWIGETLESLEGIKTAQADPHLFEKISGKLQMKQHKTHSIYSAPLLKIAAGLALLISVNVITLVLYTRSSATDTTSNPIAAGYFSYIKTVTPNP